MDQSNATIDNTLNSTLDTTGFGANSTKIDDSQIEEDNDDTEAGPDPEPEVEQEQEQEPDAEPESDDKDEGVDTANDIEVASEVTEVSIGQSIDEIASFSKSKCS